jgi:hypothetical protein
MDRLLPTILKHSSEFLGEIIKIHYDYYNFILFFTNFNSLKMHNLNI